MQKQILEELLAVKALVSRLTGTTDLSGTDPYSIKALDKAAKAFQQLCIERGEWIEEGNIDRYIKNASYRARSFIIREFGFQHYFKKGNTIYFNKNSLMQLAAELKSRNVDLKRYMELKEHQVSFEKYFQNLSKLQTTKKKKWFALPEYVRDVVTSPAKIPDVALVRQDLEALKTEFFEQNYTDYVDIYKGNYAITKYLYPYERYIKPDLLRRVRKWCDHFNIANQVLQDITRKKENFIPVPEEKMIQL